MKNNFFKVIAAFAFALFIAGCAGSTVKPAQTSIPKGDNGYRIKAVNVKLIKKVGLYDFTKENTLYPDEKRLASLLKDAINRHLESSGATCKSNKKCLDAVIDIEYRRNFNLGSVAVSAPTLNRTIRIYDADKLVYSDTKKGLQPSRGGIMGKISGELSIFTKAGKKKPNLEDEQKDLEVIAKMTAKDIVAAN